MLLRKHFYSKNCFRELCYNIFVISLTPNRDVEQGHGQVSQLNVSIVNNKRTVQA